MPGATLYLDTRARFLLCDLCTVDWGIEFRIDSLSEFRRAGGTRRLTVRVCPRSQCTYNRRNGEYRRHVGLGEQLG